MDNDPKESPAADTNGAANQSSDQRSQYTAKPDTAQARLSVFRTKHHPAPFKAVPVTKLAEQARNPRTGEKADAPVIAPHDGSGKTKAAAESAAFSAVVVDHDDGNTGRDDIENYYADTAHIAFTTSSHYQDDKGERWKVVLPLAGPLDADQWRRLSLGASAVMDGDPSQARVQQIFYVPNKISDDAPYECLVDLDSPCLSPDDALGEQFTEAGIEAESETARARPVKSGSGGSGGPLQRRINNEIDIGQVLASHGYEAYGVDRWLAPGSGSKTPGVVLLDDGDKPRVYSWHGAESDLLSAERHDNHSLDALDVVAILGHDGDIGAAQDACRRDAAQLQAAAGALDAESDSEDINCVVLEAQPLNAVDQKRVLQSVKKRTGLALSDLKEAAKEMASDDSNDSQDHRDLALRVIERIGEHDLIADDAHLWRYRAGVWRPLSPRDERSTIHKVFAEAGLEVNKSDIDGTADAIRNELYRPRHEWNVGNVEAVSCRNGLLVLDGGQWRLAPHRREEYRTAQLPVDYDPDATAPRFVQFLGEAFEGDPDAGDKATALLELIGYTLVSHARLEKFIILVGEGGNGKSKVLKLIETLCGGENTTAVQPVEMRNKFQRAGLHLKLANLVSEVPEGSVFPDAELKAITSGELMTVEHKFGAPFEIAPYSTCWFGTNHMPSTRDFSEGTFRRACVFQFNNTFELGRNADPKLDDKLRSELAGALNMALAAYAAVVDRGSFTEPESCADAKRQWRLEADQVARFIEEQCGTGEHVQTTRLYREYENWAIETGIKHTLGRERFADRVQRLGFENGKQRGERGFFGLSVEPEFTPWTESEPTDYKTASRGW